MLRLALLLAVPVAAVGEGVALRVSDFEVGAVIEKNPYMY